VIFYSYYVIVIIVLLLFRTCNEQKTAALAILLQLSDVYRQLITIRDMVSVDTDYCPEHFF